MDVLRNCARVLFQKLMATALIGFGCLLVGTAVFFFSGDTITLTLSGLVFIFSMTKCVSLYHVIAKQKYELVEGTCVGVSTKPFRKFYRVRIMDDSGVESTLSLGKQSRVKIGGRYRFYFKNSGDRISIGSEYFDTALSSDQLLGFEELSDGQNTENEADRPE